MTSSLGAATRRSFLPLLAAGLALLISACTPIPSEDAAPPESAPEVEEPDAPAEEEPADPPVQGAVSADGEDDAAQEADVPEEPAAPEAEGIAAGTIELSIESGGAERVFQYEAEHCFVSPEYILAGGTGSEVGTGMASEVGISSAPVELLHEGSDTYQAEGLISVRSEEGEVVTDGRMITVGEGYRIPSAFTYRHDDNSAHYVVAWFSGAAEIGAGYVKVQCNY